LDNPKQTTTESVSRAAKEGLYRALFECHHTVMFLTDPETAEIIDANPAACNFYGYPREVITRMHLTDINTLPPEVLFSTMSQTISNPSGWHAFQHRLAGGDLRQVEVYTGPIEFDCKKVLFSIVHDVTEKQAYLKTLEISAENFKRMAENATIGIVIFSPEGRPLFANKEISKITGFKKADLLKGGCKGIVPAIEVDKFRCAAKRLFQNEIVSHSAEIAITRQEGGKIPVEISITKTIWEQQDAILVMVNDITDRKAMEDVLRSSEERYRLLTEHSSDIIIRHFQNGEIRFISSAVTPILGFQPEFLLGRKFTEDLMHPDDWPAMAQGIKELVQKRKKTIRLEQRAKTSAGDYIWLESTCSLLKTCTDLESCQIITVSRDISERKKFQQALINNRNKLEKLVLERTRELELKSKSLEEANTALRVLLEKSQEFQKETEECIKANFEALVLPLIEKIKSATMNTAVEKPLRQLESNISEIVSPFSKNLSQSIPGLTPTQIQVADLIKKGKTSKEIASSLNMAFKTVEAHRRNIRIKLGILNKKINLRNYLSDYL
jgi:PAS domain S-box-containing protein